MDYSSKTKSSNFYYFAPPIDKVIGFAVNLAVKRKFAYSSTASDHECMSLKAFQCNEAATSAS